MDAHAISVNDEGFAQDVYDAVLGKQSDNWVQQLAAKVREVRTTLEMVHGHGPAEVRWETDLREYASRGKVTMPYSADCAVCRTQTKVDKIREDNDG